MTQDCPTCDRSWDDRAAFCGACGERLGTSLTRSEGPGSPPEATAAPSGRWRWGLLGIVVLVGGLLAVPTLRVDEPSPVPGDVGVPDADELQSVDRETPSVTAQEAEEPRAIPPPNVSCSREDTRVEVPCVLWIRRVHSAANRTTGSEQTLATDDTLVTVGAGVLRGFDTTTGRQRWEQSLGRPVDTAHLGEEVGVLHYGGLARAFALENGAWLWEVDAFSPLYGRTITDGLAHTADRGPEGPRLVVRSVQDGAVQWQAGSGGADIFSVTRSSPDGALVTTHDNRLVFLERDADGPRWRVDHGMQPLAVRDDLVVLQQGRTTGGGDGDGPLLRALDLPQGTVRWERRPPTATMPIGVQGDVLLTSAPDRLTALDVGTGQQRWTVDVDEREHAAPGPATRDPAEGADVLLTVGDVTDDLRARDPDTGELRWRHTTSEAPRTVMRTDGLLLVGVGPGLDVLDLATGRQLLRVHADGPLHAVGAGPELLVDHHSGYAVGFDFPERSVLLEARSQAVDPGQ